jgi:hypothetical protein
MTRLETLINQLNEMVLEGRTMEAFEKFYSDDVIMQENGQTPTVGKNANRVREEDFFNKIIDFRSARVLNVAVGKDVTMVEWVYDYTHKEWGDRNYNQVSVQHWRGDRVFKEQFFYGN